MQTLPVAKKLPSVTDATHLFTMMVGPETVCKSRKIPLTTEECAIVATYLDNTSAVKRLLACDLAFANSAGAALSAIPAAAANNATKAGKVADNVMDNLSEVMNIAVNLFTESFGGRLELSSVSRRSELTPETLAALSSVQRVKIDVAIPRYDLGRVDLIAVP